MEDPMTTKISIHDLSKLSSAGRNRLLQRTESDLSSFEDKVKPIIEAVRTEGDAALARFARQFDKAPVDAHAIAATEADFARAEKTLDPKVKEALEFAAEGARRAVRSNGCTWRASGSLRLSREPECANRLRS